MTNFRCSRKELQRRLQVIHSTFLLAKSLDGIRGRGEAGCEMVQKLCSKQNYGETISLQRAVSCGLEIFASALKTDEIDAFSVPKRRGGFLSSLCFFYLRFLAEESLSSKNDWKVFLKVLNSQTHWTEKKVAIQHRYGVIPFKTLQWLLTRALNTFSGIADPQTGFGNVSKLFSNTVDI